MDTKKAKYIDAIFEYFETDLTRDNHAVAALVKKLCGIDTSEAFLMWEYLLTRREKKLTEQKFVDQLILEPLEILNENNARTQKIILDSAIALKALYFYSYAPTEGISLEIILGSMLGGKYDKAEEILRLLFKNNASQKTFGQHMKTVIEKLFMEILKKMGGSSKKAELPKKLYSLLLMFVKKITTSERPLLEQRLKEVM